MLVGEMAGELATAVVGAARTRAMIASASGTPPSADGERELAEAITR